MSNAWLIGAIVVWLSVLTVASLIDGSTDDPAESTTMDGRGGHVWLTEVRYDLVINDDRVHSSIAPGTYWSPGSRVADDEWTPLAKTWSTAPDNGRCVLVGASITFASNDGGDAWEELYCDPLLKQVPAASPTGQRIGALMHGDERALGIGEGYIVDLVEDEPWTYDDYHGNLTWTFLVGEHGPASGIRTEPVAFEGNITWTYHGLLSWGATN